MKIPSIYKQKIKQGLMTEDEAKRLVEKWEDRFEKDDWEDRYLAEEAQKEQDRYYHDPTSR